MTRTAKVAVSLDAKLLERAERMRERTGESRSALVSRALRALTGDEAHARRVREYVRAYRDTPETPAEVAAARASARRSLAALPWGDE